MQILKLLGVLLGWTAMHLLYNLKMNLELNTLFLLLFWSTLQFNMGISNYSFCSLTLSVSNMKMTLVSLSIWVVTMMVLVSNKYQNLKALPNLFNKIMTALLIIMILFFLTDNLITLYIMFEASLIPTLLLILKWGYQPERLMSSFYFMMYTICASLPLLFMILKMKKMMFSLNLLLIFPSETMVMGMGFHMAYLALTMAFMVKVPMWGVHLWLPKAHVEAPVSGSMILAGILLKLGGYGLLIMVSMLFKIMTTMKLLLFSVNLWGAMMVGLICMAAIDMKVIIAYSSVIHMNMMVLGILNNSVIGVTGSILMMIAHGVSSPGLFSMANLNYEKTHSRNLIFQKGLSKLNPSLPIFWFTLTAANMAAPPSLNLASELAICMSMMKMSIFMSLIIAFITMLSGAYNLYLYAAQQMSPSKLMIPSMNMTSSNFLLGFNHSLPLYMLIMLSYLMF